MDLLHGLLVLTLVHTLAAASPGPDFVFVTQQTLARGRRAGLLSSLGIALGLSVHLCYSVFGLAAVIAHSASMLLWVKILGGSYLVYLGLRGLCARAARGEGALAAAVIPASPLKAVAAGFLCNALNPKAPIYFLSLFTLVLSPELPSWQLAVYGGWIMVIQFAWFAFVSLALSLPAVSRRFQRAGHWIDRILGGAMLLLGIKVLLARTPS